MENYLYQKDFSQQHQELYNAAEREQKARKILSILEDNYGANLGNLHLLDIGSSTGIITKILSEYFKTTTGIDIDTTAVEYAKNKFRTERLRFYVRDSMNTLFPDNSFDVVNCTHVYEHVPDSARLMDEIYRILKPGGVCFFAAGNRLIFMEAHYRLPLLSVLPKAIAHRYIRLFRKADFYYETHLTYWGLKRLTSQFEIHDYTRKVILNPVKYHATDMISRHKCVQWFYAIVLRFFYWICPTYLWILKKQSSIPQRK